MASNEKPAEAIEHKSSGEHHGNCIIHNIYTKDVSFESPNTPSIFGIDWRPSVDFDLQMGSQQLAQSTWEVVLSVTVKATLKTVVEKDDTKTQSNSANTTADTTDKEQEKTAFVAEVKQAGIFTITTEITEQQQSKMLATEFPSILFPYVREQIASLIIKGGFPQMLLPPMNFEVMYQRHLQEQTLHAKANADTAKIANSTKTSADQNKHQAKSEDEIRRVPIISMSDPDSNTSKH